MTNDDLEKNHVPTSKLYMLRCLIAMAHADGVFCDIERGYMYALMDHQGVPLSDEQYQMLEDDMSTPQRIEDLLPHINDPKYRGQVVYFARIMAYKDGNLHPNEEQLLEKLHTGVMDGIDMDALRADVKKAVDYEMEQHMEILEANRPRTGLFGLVDRISRLMGYDILLD